MEQLTLHDIRKDYHDRRVLRGVDLSLQPGNVALLGPNGAGKSTLMGILATQLKATTGHFVLDGLDSSKELIEIRKKIGLVGHQSLLYRTMTVQENLTFYARLYAIENPQERIQTLIELFQLKDRLDHTIPELSRGLLQRVAIVRALLHEPELLLLDEPFTGLDVHSTQLLLDMVRSGREEKRLSIFTTHDLQHAATCADRFLIIVKGRIQKDIPNPLSFEELRDHYQEAITQPLKKKKKKRANSSS